MRNQNGGNQKKRQNDSQSTARTLEEFRRHPDALTELDIELPGIYHAAGRVPLAWHSASYRLLCLRVSDGEALAPADGVPALGRTSRGDRSLPASEPIDLDVWQALFSKPPTHLIILEYVNKKGVLKKLLYHTLNFKLQYRDENWVAKTVCRYLFYRLWSPVDDGIRIQDKYLESAETIIIGYWLFMAKAKFKSLYIEDQKTETWTT